MGTVAASSHHHLHPGPVSAAISPEPAQIETPTHTGPVSAVISPGSARGADGRSERALRELARPQHGVLTLGQLAAVGLSPRAVRNRAARGRLAKVHLGVYAVDPLQDRGRWMAAVLACGAGATLSHRSAAALWGLIEDRPPVDVSVLTRAGRSRAGVAAHRAGTLGAADRTVRDGIPCTTLPRTLLDLAAAADRRTLERAIDRAEALSAFDLDALHDLLRRHPRRPGRRALATVLAEYDGPAATRSPAEERMLALIAAAGMPRPRVNAWIALDGNGGYEADLLWPDRRLIVEIDSRTYHARRAAFAHDRRRDRMLALAGYETRRYAVAELEAQPQQVVDELRRFLSR